MSNTLWTNHRELWAENGDALSRLYAGTGALNTSYTRSGKRTIAGMLSDATKSVSRAYINNFVDKDKQTAIDMFLVRFHFILKDCADDYGRVISVTSGKLPSSTPFTTQSRRCWSSACLSIPRRSSARS